MKTSRQLAVLLFAAAAFRCPAIGTAHDPVTYSPRWNARRHTYEIQRQRYLYEQARAFARYNYQHALVELAGRFPYPPPPLPGFWGGGQLYFWWNQQQSHRLMHPDLVAPGPWHTIPWRVDPRGLYPPAPRKGPRRF